MYEASEQRAAAIVDEVIDQLPPGPVYGCPELSAHQSRDPFGLWQSLEDRGGTRTEPPFWAVVWPGAALMARHVLDHPTLVRGKSVLDLGSGGGVAAIAAARMGAAQVVANDTDLLALAMSRRNAAINRVTLSYESRDLIAADSKLRVDVILVAEMFYVRTVAQRTERFLGAAHAKGAEIWVADGDRPFTPEHLGRVTTATIPVNRDLEGVSARTVRLLRWSSDHACKARV